MKTREILRKLLHGAKTLGMAMLGWLVLLVEALGKRLASLHIGDRLARSKLAARLGVKLSGRQIERILCVVLCLVVLVGLLSRCGAGKSTPSGNGYSRSSCGTCSGSGSCIFCGGSGKVTEFTGREYMSLNCTFCSGSGNCSSCYGSGKR